MAETITGFLGSLGLGGLFLGSIIEALGIPFPGGLMIIFAGMLVNNGEMGFAWSLILAVGGFSLGAGAAFFLGKYIGEPVFDKAGKYLKITPAGLDRARSWMRHSAAAFIIFGRFVPMVSNLTPYVAGMSKLRTERFFLYNTIFAVSWASFYLIVGMFFSHYLPALLDFTGSRLPFLAAGAVLLYITAGYIIRRKINM